MRMAEGDSVTEKMNAFKTVISQLLSTYIELTIKEKCIILLCSLLDFWDIPIVDIGSNITTLKIGNVVTYMS